VAMRSTGDPAEPPERRHTGPSPVGPRRSSQTPPTHPFLSDQPVKERCGGPHPLAPRPLRRGPPSGVPLGEARLIRTAMRNVKQVSGPAASLLRTRPGRPQPIDAIRLFAPSGGVAPERSTPPGGPRRPRAVACPPCAERLTHPARAAECASVRDQPHGFAA